MAEETMDSIDWHKQGRGQRGTRGVRSLGAKSVVGRGSSEENAEACIRALSSGTELH